MATLPVEDRLKIHRGLMYHWSQIWEEMPLSKIELYDAIAATDDWVDGNQAGFNAALPIEARTILTMPQKTLLFCAVALARVSIAFLRKVLGGIN